ncbi:MAG: hypothetical protein RL499_665 [Actinomycetota bacterium]|jgi:hypothetical protein
MTTSPRRRLLGAFIATAAVAVAVSGCSLLEPLGTNTQPVRDENGAIIEANEQTDAFALVVGDCLNDATTSGEVQTVHTVPCDEPHDSEVYSSQRLGESSYRGDAVVVSEAEALCLEAFEVFVGEPYLDSRFDFSYYYPTEASWSNGDREVLCVIYDPEGPVTGSLKGVTD